jgi:dTMP kinase
MTPRLIVIDGIDGCGKGTQIKLLQKSLSNEKITFTHEPGGTDFAEEVRELILKEKREMVPAETDFFLFWASRMSHIENVIAPALRKNEAVISDRFDSSTFAFQIHGEENFQLLDLFELCRKKYIEKLNPYYIFFDLTPEVAFLRMQKDKERTNNSFDLKPILYHERVRKGFRIFKENNTENCSIINLDRDPIEVHQELLPLIKKILEI